MSPVHIEQLNIYISLQNVRITWDIHKDLTTPQPFVSLLYHQIHMRIALGMDTLGQRRKKFSIRTFFSLLVHGLILISPLNTLRLCAQAKSMAFVSYL